MLKRIKRLQVKLIQRIMALDTMERDLKDKQEIIGETEWINRENKLLTSMVPCKINTIDGWRRIWIEKSHACNEKCKFYKQCYEDRTFKKGV